MSEFDYESYHLSISNLAMLKRLYDYGISVENFSSFMTHIEHGDSNSLDIFTNGLQHLFETTEIISVCDDADQELDLLENTSNEYEYGVIIKDTLFEQVMKNEEIFNQLKAYQGTITDLFQDVEVIWLDSKNGFLVGIHYYFYFHQVLDAIIKLKDKASELIRTEVKAV